MASRGAHELLDAGDGPRLGRLWAGAGQPPLAVVPGGAAAANGAGSRPTTVGARKTAEIAGPADPPIRGSVEDGEAFADRDLGGGGRSDALSRDPPSYGHGSRGT